MPHSEIPVVPTCPRCQIPMQAAERESKRRDMSIRVGDPSLPPIALPVFRCPTCGIERPRLSETFGQPRSQDKQGKDKL